MPEPATRDADARWLWLRNSPDYQRVSAMATKMETRTEDRHQVIEVTTVETFRRVRPFGKREGAPW